MLRIAIASGFKAHYGGNFISQIIHLGNCLEKLGYKVVYIFPTQAQHRDWCRQMIDDGNNLYFIKPQNVFLDLITLWRLIYSLKIDIIHNHFGMLDLPSAITSVLYPRFKNIIHARAEDPTPKNIYRYLLRRIKTKYIYSKTHVIAISNNIFNQYVKYGLQKKRIIMIEGGIAFMRLIINETKKDLRGELGIQDEVVFLMMGYNLHIKGVDIVIKSLNLLQEDKTYTRRFILAIIVASNLEELKSEITKLFGHVPPFVVFLPPTEYIANYYNIADCFISASRTEGFSNSIAEAIHMKLPVISSDIVGTRWATKYNSVLSFQNEHSNDLLIKIQNIFKCIESSDIEINSQKIEEDYGIENWSNRIIDFYNTQAVLPI